VRQLREVYRREQVAGPAPHVDPGIEWREIGLLPPVEHPESNPFNATKVELGRLLFFDRRLSADGKMACVSCHEPNLGWADGRPVSQPHGRSPDRNTPTIRNVAFQKNLFWDGRAGSLEQQGGGCAYQSGGDGRRPRRRRSDARQEPRLSEAL
jgi:cytochrome c peroxidase